MNQLTSFLSQPVGPFTWGALLAALGLIVAAYVLRAIINLWLARHILAFTDRTETEADDVAARALITPLGQILPLLGLYLAFRFLAKSGAAR